MIDTSAGSPAPESVQKMDARHKLGCIITINVGTMSVQCVVEKYRWAYGRQEYLVVPLAGDGYKWVSSKKIKERT